jgi:hypothetical protein
MKFNISDILYDHKIKQIGIITKIEKNKAFFITVTIHWQETEADKTFYLADVQYYVECMTFQHYPMTDINK